MLAGTVKRWSVDCKATVKIGDFSRGGQTRGDNQASDHDFGCEEKYTPFGIVDEDSAQLDLIFGSSYKTSDFISLHNQNHDLKPGRLTHDGGDSTGLPGSNDSEVL